MKKLIYSFQDFIMHSLFTTIYYSSEKSTDIEARVRELAFLNTLHEKPDEFRERMFKYVYPSLDGTAHGTLTYFYTLLSNIPLENDNLSAGDHVKILKRIKSSAPGEALCTFRKKILCTVHVRTIHKI